MAGFTSENFRSLSFVKIRSCTDSKSERYRSADLSRFADAGSFSVIPAITANKLKKSHSIHVMLAQ